MDKKKKRLIMIAVRIAVAAVLVAVMLGLAAPVCFVLIRSFSSAEDMFPMRLLPEKMFFGNFTELFSGTGESDLPFSRNIFCSLIVTLITAAVQIPVVGAMAYVLAKIKAPGVRIFNTIIEWSLILTPMALYVPQYLFMSKIGVSDSVFALILPFVASPLAVYLMKKSMDKFPDEIIYCARLDGASEFKICFGIVMPYIKPAWLTVLVLTVGNSWSLSGELLVSSAGVEPLGALMPVFSASEETAGVFCAVAAIIIVPLIILSILCRREIALTLSRAGLRNETKPDKTEKK